MPVVPTPTRYQVRARVDKTGGQISPRDAALLLWQDRELQKDADLAATNFGHDSKEYQAAEKEWLEWRDWEQNTWAGWLPN